MVWFARQPLAGSTDRSISRIFIPLSAYYVFILVSVFTGLQAFELSFIKSI